MGIFDKLFGKGNSNNNDLGFGRTSELMEENLYWKIGEIISLSDSSYLIRNTLTQNADKGNIRADGSFSYLINVICHLM